MGAGVPVTVHLSFSAFIWLFHDVYCACVLCMCIKGFIRSSLCVLHLSKNVEENIIPILQQVNNDVINHTEKTDYLLTQSDKTIKSYK